MKSLILFSNREEINHALINSDNYQFLFDNFSLSNEEWILYFDTYCNKFNKLGKNIPEIDTVFVVYDGESDKIVNCQLKLDDNKKGVLRKINRNSKNIHIVFHRKPPVGIQKEILDLFPSNSNEHSMHDRKKSSTYYQVYNSLFYLFHNGDQSKKTEYLNSIFPNENISNINDLIEVIFKRVDKTTTFNEKLELLHLCLTPEGIKGHEKEINGYFKEFDLNYFVDQLKNKNYDDIEYQNFLADLSDNLLR